MKKIISWKILSVFAAVLMLFAACEKDDPVKLEPKLATWEITDITSTSAIVSGFVIAEGDGFIEHGVCWSLEAEPTIADNAVKADNVEKAVYSVTVDNLEFLTTYHVRAYTKSSEGSILYGQDTTFTTLANIPFLELDSVYDITASTASGDVNVTNDGKSEVSARGLCWSTETEPTVDDAKTEDGAGIGRFTGSIIDLIGGTTYYVRAYATNEMGTAYSNEINFVTPAGLAVVTTDSVKNVAKTTATVYGNVVNEAGADVTERGVCYATTADPTIADSKVVVGAGMGDFSADLTELTAGTVYYARAYATNSEGTSYGENIEFKTVVNIWKFWVVGDYNGWDNSDNALFILSTETDPNAEGYINFESTGSFKLTTDHSWEDAYTYGDDGTTGGVLANPGDNIAIDPAGYYFITANGEDMTYSLTQTVWGIMGSFNDWTNQIDMNYDIDSKTFRLAQTFSAGDEFKFRGTSDWAFNYGSDAADGTLNKDGANISVSIAGDYAITMDLSHPNAYTYSANTWGIIGDFNNWGDDVNMTWDAANNVFTADISVSSDGGFKFRANDDWAVNLGGDINALTQDGANIAITAGNYTITLDPWSKVATITQN